jgi:hypothetical protein
MTALTMVVAVAVAACAGSGGSGSSGSHPASNAQSLLRQSLEGKHRITSGVLSLRATVTPHGTSSSSSTPITISFGGPFQSLGSGRVTESDFTVAVVAGSQRLLLGLRTTATAGYMRLNGSWFKLPATEFAQLRKSLATSGSSGLGSLPGLSVRPLRWLTDPQLLGTATVDGTQTTEVQARIDVAALADELGTVLAKEKSDPALSTSGLPAKLTAAQRQQLISELRNPTVQLFIGSADHTLRQAILDLNLKVPAKMSSELPGISSVGVAVTVNYADLNRPQTITAPAQVKPYDQLSMQLSGLLDEIDESTAGTTNNSAGASGASGSPTGGATGSAGGASGSDTKYDQCLSKAAGNVTELEKCASLIDAPAD